MTLEKDVDQGFSLDSYLVGYLHNALNEIADCLTADDSNKAMRKVYEAIKHLKDNLQFKSSDKENISMEENLSDERILHESYS